MSIKEENLDNSSHFLRYVQGHHVPGDTLYDRDLDLKVGHRVCGAGVEPAEFLVHGSAAIAYRRDEDVACEELGSAVSALAASAVGVDRDACSLECYSYRLVCCCVDDILMDAAPYGDLICLADLVHREARDQASCLNLLRGTFISFMIFSTMKYITGGPQKK